MLEIILQRCKSFKGNYNLLRDSIKLIFLETKRQFIFLLLGIIIQGIMPSVTIWLSAHIINAILAYREMHSHINIVSLCLMWAASLFLTNLVQPWVIYWQSNIADIAVNKINSDIIYKSNSIEKLIYFEQPEFYDDIQLLRTQASSKPLNLVVTLVGLLRDFFIIISSLILLYSVVPWICIIVLFSAYINYRVFSFLQEKTWQESLGRSIESRKMSYISSISLDASYAKEIRFFNLGAYLLNEYTAIFKKIYDRMRTMRFKQAIWPIYPFTVSIIGNLIAFYTVVRSTLFGKTGIGSVALFLQTLSQLHISVTDFGEQSGWLKGHLLFFEKFFNFLKLDENVYSKKFKGRNLANLEKFSIRFENVTFAYNNRLVLKNISFVINPDEKIAIVGTNGAGKSTLIKLLCGFYAPTSGKIFVNDVPLSNMDPMEWRHKISPVFQDFNSYSFSLKQNIQMGLTNHENSRLDQAIFQSGVNEFINQLPNDIEELMGKDFGGTDLSQGQWQKVALARALHKDASLFVLDEPTASLDPMSEYEIFTKFSQLTKNKTVIFVTHRMGSVTMADNILLLHNGELIDQGNHEKLIVINSLYREMFEKQASYYIRDKDQIKKSECEAAEHNC